VLDAVTSAIITGAAGNIVAQMLSGQVEALRARVAQLFGKAGASEAAQAVKTLDADADALSRGETTEAAVNARWIALLSAHLIEHPDVKAAVEALASTSDENRVGVQINTGSGTFIGRDNNTYNWPVERNS